jgi:signal transduction histidine kinase
MKFEVENAIRKIAEQVSEPHLRPLQAIFPLIHDTIEEVGRIAMDLRPSILDHLGVLATVAWVCREFNKTHSGIRLEKQIDLEEDQISEHQKIVIFRILQEALNNVAKHSRSSLVQVRLLNIDGRVELTIKDNGVGLDCEGGVPDDIYGRGFGLASMKERARLSGGSFSVESSRGSGTVVKASWPEDGTQPKTQQSRFL